MRLTLRFLDAALCAVMAMHPAVSAGATAQYRARYKIDIPLTLDESGRLFREFGVTGTPTVVVADAAGTVVRRIDSDATTTLSQSLNGL